MNPEQQKEAPSGAPPVPQPQLTHKHVVAPINEAAVKKELADKPAPKPQPHPETAAVTSQPSQQPQQASAAPAPAVRPPEPEPSRIGDVQGLRLYALVTIILSGLSLLNLVTFQGFLSSYKTLPTTQIGNIVAILLPLLAGIYLLVGKDKLIISALLVVIGITLATSLAYLLPHLQLLLAALVASPMTVFYFAYPVGMLAWTIAIFLRVQRT